MNRRSIKQRLLRTRVSLRQTLSRILDINRKRKVLSHLQESEIYSSKLEDELRMLNNLASSQANLVRKYEKDLSAAESA